jgi:hypothetical protein
MPPKASACLFAHKNNDLMVVSAIILKQAYLSSLVFDSSSSFSHPQVELHDIPTDKQMSLNLPSPAAEIGSKSL